MSTQTPTAPNPASPVPVITDGMRVRKAHRLLQPVYLMINGRAHHVTDQVARDNLFGNTDSTPIEDLRVTIGAEIGDGYLAREDGTKAVYLVYDGFKRHIPNPEVFEKQFGFDWKLVRVVPAGSLNAIPNGPDVG